MRKKIPIDRIVDFASGQLSREESLALLNEIEHDQQASQDLDLIASMMDVVETEGDNLFAEKTAKPESVFSRLRSFGSSLLPKLRAHPVLSGAAAFAAVLAAIMVMLPQSSPYGTMASVRDYDFGATVRGVELEDFNAAFDLYREGEYEESIKLFERYIRAFPRSKLLEYAHYSAGAAYLRWSEWRFSSLFIGFDRGRVQKGIEHLQEVVRVSGNGRLLEDVHWLLAKGSLMISNPGLAMDELHIVVQMGGSRRDEAAEMIQELQTLQRHR
jgi:tetratricopeptide (TPR) repeat protein